MENFDFEKIYYRPVDIRNGYASDDDDLINDADGSVESEYINIEFSSLWNVGAWLLLGDEVKVLKIPKDAELVKNTPMGQGGCYEYSSNKVIVQETISVFEFLKQANEKLMALVHVKNVKFAEGFKLKSTDYAILDECTFQGNLLEHQKFTTIKLWNCNIKGELLLPERIEELSISNSDTTNFDLDIRFPKRITQNLDLTFLEIKKGLDLSEYTCNYINFDFCDFISVLTLPKIQKEHTGYDNNGNKIDVDEGSIVFSNCFGLENIIIPENFTGERSLRFENSPVSSKLTARLRQAAGNCLFKDISFDNAILQGSFFQNVKAKEIHISQCKITEKLLLPELLDTLTLFKPDKKQNVEIQFPQKVTKKFWLQLHQITEELDMSEYACGEIYFNKCKFLNSVILPKKQIYSSSGFNSECTIEFAECTGLEKIVIPKEFEEGRTIIFHKTDVKPGLVQELKQKYGCKVVL